MCETSDVKGRDRLVMADNERLRLGPWQSVGAASRRRMDQRPAPAATFRGAEQMDERPVTGLS